ncbi:MAG: sterol desaturase family protein [Bryobacteraceae bacterium]
MEWIQIENRTLTTAFVAIFLALAVWESWQPRRALTEPTARRWVYHGVLYAVTVILYALAVRTSPVLVALAVEAKPWGLLNREWIPWPARFAAGILVLDLVHYATHRLFHTFGALWRIHEVHHSDVDYDVSTAVRFHPVEVAATSAIYLAVIALMAPPAVAVFTAELHTTVVNLLSHANVSLPWPVERAVRLVLITPDLHRIHHSTDIVDQNRNFGQSLVWWDRLLGTYSGQTRSRQGKFSTGLAGLPAGTYGAIADLFLAPFRRRP